MPKPFARSTSGPPASSASGATSSTRSKNSPNATPARKIPIPRLNRIPQLLSNQGAKMILTATRIDDLVIQLDKEIHVRASLEITFDAMLTQLGPGNTRPDGEALPLTIEPWPGGRWYRDLGNNNGHHWGHVQ